MTIYFNYASDLFSSAKLVKNMAKILTAILVIAAIPETAFGLLFGGHVSAPTFDIQDKFDDVHLVNKFLKELMNGDLQGCHPVLLDTQQTLVSRTVSDLQQEFLLSSDFPLITYNVESFIQSLPPSTPLLRYRATKSTTRYCIAYYLIAPLNFVEEALTRIPKSDMFSGAARYFVIYSGMNLTITDLEKNKIHLEAYNTFKLPLLSRWQTRNYPQKSMESHSRPLEEDRPISRPLLKLQWSCIPLYEPADGQWGYQLSNGSFTGVLGVVQRYEADFSMDISITAEREEVIDFTIGFHSEPLSFVTSKPQPLPQWLALIRPYQLYVWICFAVAVTLAGPIYYFLLRTTNNPTYFTSSAFVMFATLVNQGCRWPQTTSVRVYCIFWIFFSMIATMSYVGNLTAFLTVPEMSPTVDNLEELSRSSFVWGINDYGAADYQLFKSSKVPLYQRIFRGLTFCPSLVECVQRTLDRRFAFISWRTYLRDVIATNFTEKTGYTPVYLSKESFWPGDIGYAMQKGSPMKASNRCFSLQSPFLNSFI
ncbi:hypothetical protein SK128_012676 [Halocaridina rubra]|uniref:Ionotropic glutamate receptor C-terminal domain-containing protein n=1 Tax=Halocaridina rubra TaxID=373956 RepID=A0AAN8X6G6_HALRR